MPNRISSGNAGLDTILKGGLPRNRLYLLEGSPGSGKTTFALQYLLEGVRLGDLKVRCGWLADIRIGECIVCRPDVSGESLAASTAPEPNVQRASVRRGSGARSRRQSNRI